MKRRKVIAAAFAAAAMIVAAACGGDDAAEEITEETEAVTEETTAPAEDYSMVKAAVVYLTTPGDQGWTYMHDLGIGYMEEQLGIEVTRLELIPEGAEATAVYDKLARDGYNLIL